MRINEKKMSPRGKAQNEQMRAETLAKITDASLKVFADYGYHGATMKKIAQATGLSYGLVYHYFASKEAIFRSLVDHALENSQNSINTALDIPGTAWEKLENLSKFMVENAFTGETSRLFLIMIQAMTQGKAIPGLVEHIEDVSQAHYAKLLPVVIEAQMAGKVAEGDPIILTAAFFSFIQGLSILVFQEKGMEQRITPDILLNVLRKGD